MSDREIKLGVSICLAHWMKNPPGDNEPIEEVAKRAFRMVRDDSYVWFTKNDDHLFRIGCGVLLMHYKDTPTFETLQYTLNALKALSAMMTGVPVDLSQVIDEERETLPLLPWYKETAA